MYIISGHAYIALTCAAII